MKRLTFIPAVLLMLSCVSQSNLQKDLEKHPVLSCPEPESCTFEVIPDKTIVTSADGTGQLYYKLEDSSDTKVIKYRFDKKTDAALADAGYSEEVVFELRNDALAPYYNAEGIANTNMIFGVMCFCKGKAGFYKVKNGTLSYKNNILNITLPDIIEGQRLKDISINFQ